MSPENFDFAMEQHPALKARERLIASLKAQFEAGEYLISGEAIGGKMVDDAIEEAHIRDLAEQFISDRRALDNLPAAYCYVHNHRYAANAACCYCVNGVPMAPGHTDEARQMQRNAQREIDWHVRRQALNGAKRQGLAEGEKPLRLGRLRGGWLRQRRLERAAECGAQRDAQAGSARLFPVPVEPRRNWLGLAGLALFCIVSAGFFARWWHGG